MQEISVGQLKRELSSLLNLVAYGRERLVVQSRGRAKAAIVSLEDLERLERLAGDEGRREREQRLLDELAAFRSRQESADVAQEVRRLREDRVDDRR